MQLNINISPILLSRIFSADSWDLHSCISVSCVDQRLLLFILCLSIYNSHKCPGRSIEYINCYCIFLIEIKSKICMLCKSRRKMWWCQQICVLISRVSFWIIEIRLESNNINVKIGSKSTSILPYLFIWRIVFEAGVDCKYEEVNFELLNWK